MLILEVNGQAVLHPEDLMDAVRKSGRSFQLTIVDLRPDARTSSRFRCERSVFQCAG